MKQKKRILLFIQPIGILLLFFVSTLIYLFPLLQGLMLLPLDMLVSNYAPWYSPGQILIKNPYMQDSIIQYFPWRHVVFQSFHQGILPLWNPFQFMGMPFMAGLKTMVFYPLNILFLFGEVPGWNALLFLQILLSLYFMYLLTRSFKLGFFPSILSSLAFSLNTLMVGVLEFGSEGHVLLWLPLFFYCVKKYLDNQKGIYLFILGSALASSIFAGQLQYTGYAMILLTAFIFYYGHVTKTNKYVYLNLFFTIGLGIGISAIQLLPSIELFAHSSRGIENSYHIFTNGLNQPQQVFRLFAPDFFGNPVSHDATIGYIESIGYFGIIPLFFALYAILLGRKNKLVVFFSIGFIVSILLAIQGIGQILYFLHIPLLTSGEGDRISTLMYFCGSILAGYGLTEFLENSRKRKILSILGFAFIFVAIIMGTLFSLHARDTQKEFFHNISFSLTILGIFSIELVAKLIS